MSRISGRKGRLYVGIASDSAAAEPIAYLRQFSINFPTDNQEVTAFGDDNKVYVSGLPDCTGSYSGFYDTATAQLYTAARDGAARRFYLYPTTDTTSQYWFGTALFDFSVDQAVDGPVTISGDFVAATAVTKVG